MPVPLPVRDRQTRRHTRRRQNKSIAEQSQKINVIWAEIYHTLKMIGYTVADWGLTPLVLGPLNLVKRIFDEIDAEVTQIKKDFPVSLGRNAGMVQERRHLAGELDPGGKRTIRMPGSYPRPEPGPHRRAFGEVSSRVLARHIEWSTRHVRTEYTPQSADGGLPGHERDRTG